MALVSWLVSNKDIIEIIGVIGALVFSGLGFHIDARVRGLSCGIASISSVAVAEARSI